MKHVKSFSLVPGIMLGLLLSPFLAGCSQSGLGTTRKNDAASSGGSDDGPGFGGTTNAGGGPGTGGVNATGGGTNSGGATGAGGSVSTGGAKATGGVNGNGGSIAAGGTTGNGGTTGEDGGPDVSVASGGSSGNGGNIAATGGSTGAGGSTACPALPAAPTGTMDAVAGTLITFNDDGGWSWYQDERAIVDKTANKLVIGSVAFNGSRSGNIEAVIYDLKAGTKTSPAKLGNISVDDHSAPAFNIRPDGKYVAVWAGHRVDCKTYYNIYDGANWSAAMNFDWAGEGCPWDGSNTHMITYSNVWWMSPTQLFDIARSISTSPAILSSSDNGETWSLFGRLTSNPSTGYTGAYFKYWGNNTDRIDFLATEAHPRDNDNNLWHGYIKGGKIYDSAGGVVDDTLGDLSGKEVTGYTQVFKTGSSLGGVKLDHAWNHDIVRYDDGTIAILGQARVVGSGTSDPDKRMFYGRWDGTSWKLTYIAKLGPKLNSSEEDYTGLGALHPDNPHIIYISTPYDPSDDIMKTSKREIYQGVTCDNGATWKWTPVTKGSTKDNIRPIVPKWDTDHTALLWMRGSFNSASTMSANIVGTISGP